MTMILILIGAFITGAFGYFVANTKGRDGKEGFVLGFLFSLFGVLIEALLPTMETTPVQKPVTRPVVARPVTAQSSILGLGQSRQGTKGGSASILGLASRNEHEHGSR